MKKFGRNEIIATGLTVVALMTVAATSGCGGHDSNTGASEATLKCDDTMKTGFKPDGNTSVLAVKAFKAGDALILSGTVSTTTLTATSDVCVVKLNVGPGNPGPTAAPSTSPGIGIEVWLPTAANWNNRIHVKGGGGWAGGPEGNVSVLAGASTPGDGTMAPATIAMNEGAVSASTDTGHVSNPPVLDASFAMNPDGSINTTLWNDFAQRGIHEMAVKTKALTKAFYGRDAKYAYWDGFSTGGRQAHKEAQVNPTDFNGIMAGAPAINWTKFITTELYPQTVMQRDLGGVLLTSAQLSLASNAAISGCDVVGGQHLGYIPNPYQCRYNPANDPSVLCKGTIGSAGAVGANSTSACLTEIQATAMNKMWYGQTPDGSVPDPAIDNGASSSPTGSQLWYGLTRGTNMSALAGATQFPIASEMVALELQNPRLASTFFKNATGDGTNGWTALGYPDLANAWSKGVALQSQFANINTDNPDLSAFRDSGGKMIVYHGLADTLIPSQGSVNYYNRVANQMGGIPSIQNFYRLYLVPGMAHGFSNGTANPNANPPLPTPAQIYSALTAWVENGATPGTLTANAPVTATSPAKSRPLCVYPLNSTFTGGDPNQAASYSCSQ